MGDPTDNLTEQYRAHVNDSSHFITLTSVASRLSRCMARLEDLPDADIQYFENVVPTLQAQEAIRAVDIVQKRQILADADAVRNNRQDNLNLPENRPIDVLDISIKDLKAFVGNLDESNANTVKAFFHKLIQYGESRNFSHNNYKTALSALLQGQLQEQYLAMEDSTFTVISLWLYRVYHRPDDLRKFEHKLKNFSRMAFEPLTAFMERFELVARQADALLPQNQAYYTTDRHKLKIIEKLIQPPARAEYLNWRGIQEDGGLNFSYARSLQKATDMERNCDCLPTRNIPINTLEVHVSAVEKPGHELSNTEEANPAIRRPKGDNKHSPYPTQQKPTNIDPHKSNSPRSNYYHKPQQDPLQNPNLAKNFKKGKFNKTKRNWNNKNKNNNASNPSYQPPFQPQAPPPPPQNPTGNSTNYPPPQRPPQPNWSRPTQNRNYDTRPGFSGKPQQVNQPYRDYNNRKIPGLVCFKCGVLADFEKSKRIGSTHTTKYCKNYRLFNNDLCSYCLGHKGIRAHHFPKHCLNMPHHSVLEVDTSSDPSSSSPSQVDSTPL